MINRKIFCKLGPSSRLDELFLAQYAQHNYHTVVTSVAVDHICAITGNYLFIIKSYTKYTADRDTVRTLKTVKASTKHKY